MIKKARNLKESKKRYRGGAGGRKGKRKMVFKFYNNYIIINITVIYNIKDK